MTTVNSTAVCLDPSTVSVFADTEFGCSAGRFIATGPVSYGLVARGEERGVFGTSTLSGKYGVHGKSSNPMGRGVLGESIESTGVEAVSSGGTGLFASSESGFAINAQSNFIAARLVTSSTNSQPALFAATVSGGNGNGITGTSGFRNGVEGQTTAQNASGVYGEANGFTGQGGFGVAGRSNRIGGAGIFGEAVSNNWAGFFQGDVHVNGTLSKTFGTFKIDHPQDPANKYLSHSFVESPEMLNVYSGSGVADSNGEASVTLPQHWHSLNVSPRYFLTPIGAAATPFVKTELDSTGRFQVGGLRPGMRFSWMVTGVRNDPWARAHPMTVEAAKPAFERGKYLNPEVYAQPSTARLIQGPLPSRNEGVPESSDRPYQASPTGR
jgi:hypothetical protein